MAAALPALAASAIAGVFAAQLVRQYADRRRHHALAWAVALGLFALASLSVVIGVLGRWSPPVFAVYWFSGGLLTVPFLAAGQLMLLDPKRTPLYWTVVGLAAVWAIAALAMAPFDTAVLARATAADGLPIGREVLGEEALAFRLLRPFSYTFAAVVIGAIWSAVRTRRWGLLWIALGVTIAAVSHMVARGRPAIFALSLAVGVGLMYIGFLAAAKPSKRAAPLT